MSERFRIVGGAHLKGEVHVPGAKNSVLKLMAASLLAPGKNTITNVPDILDVEIMIELLERLGCKVNRLQSKVEIDVQNTLNIVLIMN
jgi:UDP-N-acetylglucosamine 1-carboxyvinyltransferase